MRDVPLLQSLNPAPRACLAPLTDEGTEAEGVDGPRVSLPTIPGAGMQVSQPEALPLCTEAERESRRLRTNGPPPPLMGGAVGSEAAKGAPFCSL